MMRHALIAAEKIVEKYAKAMNYKPPYSLAEVDEVAKIVEEAGNLMVVDALAKRDAEIAGRKELKVDDAAVQAEQLQYTLPTSEHVTQLAASKEKPAANGAAGKQK